MSNKSLTFDNLMEAYSPNVNKGCIDDIRSFLDYLKSLNLTKMTHYVDLDSFYKAEDFLSKILDKHGFINGNPEKNNKNLEVSLLWALYREIDCAQYSNFYYEVEENVPRHHISAYARNYCLIKEVELFLNNYKKIELI